VGTGVFQPGEGQQKCGRFNFLSSTVEREAFESQQTRCRIWVEYILLSKCNRDGVFEAELFEEAENRFGVATREMIIPIEKLKPARLKRKWLRATRAKKKESNENKKVPKY
jgi:hypothetical protein